MTRPRIYVAGPLTADTPEERAANITRAIDIAEQLWALGWAPVVPHTQGEAWHARHPHRYEEWMELCRSWQAGCAATFRMEGASSGADREVVWAGGMFQPVFWSLDQSAAWLEARARAMEVA